MESWIWATRLTVPSICGAAIVVLIYFVKPLIIKWMEVCREIIKLRKLARLLERDGGLTREEAIAQASKLVFGTQARPSTDHVPETAKSQSLQGNSPSQARKSGTMRILRRLLRRH